MLKIGQFNRLQVAEIFPFGYALKDPEQQDDTTIFLKESDRVLSLEEEIEAFVFTQADGSLIATIDSPVAKMQEFAPMIVVGTSAHGCFFDWGIKPDLYAPEGQLHAQLDMGIKYVVRVVHDKLGKVVGTTKIERFLETPSEELQANQEVSLLIYAQTPLGFKAIVNNRYQGLLFKSDLIHRVAIGDKLSAYIKSVRDDGKIDLSLQAQGEQARKSLNDAILEDLIAHDGMSTLTDKSSPDDIYARFKVSKAAYKKAIGNLYKQKKILIKDKCLYLNK